MTAKPKVQRFDMRIDTDWLEIVDDLRRHEKDVPTRAEYLRRLVVREYQRMETVAA